MASKKIKHFSVSILLLFAAVTCSFAQDTESKHAILTNKLQLGIGLFYPSKTFDIGVNGSSRNDEIEFDETFDLKDSEITLFAGFEWRFAKKWRLATDYFGVQNSGSRILKEDLVWDNFTLEKGTNASGIIKMHLYRLYVGRIFSSGAKHEFGGGLGIHAINTDVTVEGDVLTSEGDNSFESSRKTAMVPLPNIALWYYYAPNTKWAFTANFDVFYMKIGDYSGNLVNFSPGVNYQFFRNISASINYRFIDIGASVDSSNWDGDINFGFHGPSFTINANF